MIREATINDTDSLARILLDTWNNAYEGIIDPNYPKTMSKDKYVKIINNNIKNNVEKILVFEKDDAILGFVSGKLQSGKYDSEVIGLYIHPESQGKGIGSELLKEMKSYFMREKCKCMIIWTLLDAKNNQFYRKHGGVEKENKEIEIGTRKYSGIGFVFNL